jgi:hypothetical protein
MIGYTCINILNMSSSAAAIMFYFGIALSRCDLRETQYLTDKL